MDKKLENMIEELFNTNNDNKSIFKVYKHEDNICLSIANMDFGEIKEISINIISKMLDLFPIDERADMIQMAVNNCKSENGMLFGGDDDDD